MEETGKKLFQCFCCSSRNQFKWWFKQPLAETYQSWFTQIIQHRVCVKRDPMYEWRMHGLSCARKRSFVEWEPDQVQLLRSPPSDQPTNTEPFHSSPRQNPGPGIPEACDESDSLIRPWDCDARSVPMTPSTAHKQQQSITALRFTHADCDKSDSLSQIWDCDISKEVSDSLIHQSKVDAKHKNQFLNEMQFSTH